MSMTDNRSSAEIERDVERTRDRLRDTLETLRDRASPGQIFEQVLDYARESGAPEMMRNMGRAMRDNPMPLLLIGAGIGWMIFADRRGNGGRRDNGGGSYDYGDDHDYGRRWTAGPDGRRRGTTMRRERQSGHAALVAGEAASGVREGVSGAAERVGEAVSGIADSARETAGQVGEMASSTYRRVTRAAGSAGESLSSVAEGARGYAADARHQADRGLRWLLHEQPLLLGALGLALGAAVGALVPGTETEDRWMGETREDVLGRARETAEEGYESLKDRASHLAGQAGEATGEAGSGISDAVRNAARGARESVSQAAKDMADQAKSALDEVGRTGDPRRPANEPGTPPNRT